MEKRVQGRPSRAAGVVGRTKIVADIRMALRSAEGLQVSRKTLAQAIGATPALITYYFPAQEALLKEVCVPVIEAHRITLSGIVNRRDQTETKLREIISVLHELYGTDRRLYELYRGMEERHPEDYVETLTMTNILSSFFDGHDDTDRPPSFEAVVLQGAVRRMCEFAEQVKRDTAVSRESTVAPDAAPSWLESMCSLFVGLCSAYMPRPAAAQ